mmetsp:Transcript_52435/g.60240  ORF Transcript_52435/g.60240 Transcript_52435/m.60240 type:complete len:158 (-) Transcript_52435:192-665(-)
MGRVRTKTVKKAAKNLIEKYYLKLTSDFHVNKKILSEVAIVPTKRLRNKIAGFATHLMKRIQRGPIRGISLKIQEEERERRMDYVPDQSSININHVTITQDAKEMLKRIGMAGIPGLVEQRPAQREAPAQKGHREKRERRERGEKGEKGGDKKETTA